MAPDDPESNEQLRPALKELGDSVTSAVRWEGSDEDEDEGSAAAAGAVGGAAAASTAALRGGGLRDLSAHRQVNPQGSNLETQSQQQQQLPQTSSDPMQCGPACLPSTSDPHVSRQRRSSAPGTPSSVRASPFMRGYDFAGLGASAAMGGPSGGGSSSGAPSGQCSVAMITAGSSIGGWSGMGTLGCSTLSHSSGASCITSSCGASGHGSANASAVGPAAAQDPALPLALCDGAAGSAVIAQFDKHEEL